MSATVLSGLVGANLALAGGVAGLHLFGSLLLTWLGIRTLA